MLFLYMGTVQSDRKCKVKCVEDVKCIECCENIVDEEFLSCINCVSNYHNNCFEKSNANHDGFTRCVNCNQVGAITTSSVDFLYKMNKYIK